jgi:flavin-dependent dehydrogenase
MKPIAPTLTLEEATDGIWDVLVVGAGCAGAIAAREMGRCGARVLLVDKANFPRFKVCGGCLNRCALDALQRLGLGELPSSNGGIALNRFHIVAGSASAVLPLPGHVALSRETLDTALVSEAIRAGAFFLPGVRVSMSDSFADYRSAQLRADRVLFAVRARLVLAADGLGSKLLTRADAVESEPHRESYIGAGAVLPHAPDSYRAGTIYMACGARGYVGLVRGEGNRLIIAAALDQGLVREKRGLSSAVESILQDASLQPVPDLHAERWRGTPLLTRRTTRYAAHRAFVLGDAAGYVEPFTGEGMGWAISAGEAVAPVARRALERYDASCLREWEAYYRGVVGRRQSVCRVISWGLRRPRLTRCAIAVINQNVRIAAAALGLINGPLRTTTGMRWT